MIILVPIWRVRSWNNPACLALIKLEHPWYCCSSNSFQSHLSHEPLSFKHQQTMPNNRPGAFGGSSRAAYTRISIITPQFEKWNCSDLYKETFHMGIAHSKYETCVFCSHSCCSKGSTIRVLSASPLGSIVQIYAYPANIVTGPSTKNDSFYFYNIYFKLSLYFYNIMVYVWKY